MPDKFYKKFPEKELILRDHLALDRTTLANERTFLAYVRTALTLFVAGVSLIQFFDIHNVRIAGLVMIPLGFVVLAVGWFKYKKIKRRIGGYIRH